MLALWSSRLATGLRFGRARRPKRAGRRPQGKLILYEFEGCPWCRRVREAITDLDLKVEVRPCPKGGERYRGEAAARSGKKQFPFLIDEDAGVEMLESGDIARHLYANYGSDDPPFWLFGLLFPPSSQFASVARMGAGTFVRASRLPEGEIQLVGDESDPAARIVRERLCELELPYVRSSGPLKLTHGDVVLTELSDILAHVESHAA